VVKVSKVTRNRKLWSVGMQETEKHGKGYFRARRDQILSFIPSISSNFCALDA